VNPNGIEYVQSTHRSRRLMQLSRYFEEYLFWKIVSLSTLIDVIGLRILLCEDTLLRSLAIK
jgi:hypothetical protein